MSTPHLPGRWRRAAVAATATVIALSAATLVAPAAEAAPSTSVAKATAAVRTFHVDCRAASGGDGSQSRPWNSLGRINSYKGFTAGDAILLKRGTTCTGRLHPSGSGSASAPIVLGAYGTAKTLPTVAGKGTSPNATAAIELLNQAYWTIQDLHVTNNGSTKETSVYRSGVFIKNEAGGRLAGITVQRLQIDSVVSNLTMKGADAREFGGISVWTWPGERKDSGFDGLRILSNRITKVGRTGIMVSNHGYPTTADKQVRISSNRITRARGDSIVLRGSKDARIDHNVSANGADFWPCAQCGPITPDTANAAIWPANSLRVRIDHNEVYGEHRLGGDGEAFDIDMSAKDITVEYNYAHDNQGGGILFCGSSDVVARFNILENNQQGAFTFIGSIPAQKTKIYNNTVYNSPSTGALIVRTFGGLKGKDVTFFNNLIYNMSDKGYYVWPTTVKSRTNTFVGVHGIAEPRGPGEGFIDPGLKRPGTGGTGFGSLGGYRPVSPKNDPAGSAIPSSVKTDFFGKAINPKRPPRGAAG